MRAKILVSALVAAASFGCAVKLNGKSYGPGTSSPAGGSSGSSAGSGAGAGRPFWIASARIGVLTWRPGGKVTIVGSAAKGSLAVDRADVILPSP